MRTPRQGGYRTPREAGYSLIRTGICRTIRIPLHAVVVPPREGGGIGRRARFRSWSRKGCGFESRLSQSFSLQHPLLQRIHPLIQKRRTQPPVTAGGWTPGLPLRKTTLIWFSFLAGDPPATGANYATVPPDERIPSGRRKNPPGRQTGVDAHAKNRYSRLCRRQFGKLERWLSG